MQILIVDGNWFIRHVTRDVLLKPGVTINLAASCAEARERIHEKPYDWVILDGDLLDGNSLDLLRELRGAVNHNILDFPVRMSDTPATASPRGHAESPGQG